MRAALALLAIGTVPVTACSPSDNDPGPGGVTVGEARALDEAAEMIEQRRIPADVLAEKELARLVRKVGHARAVRLLELAVSVKPKSAIEALEKMEPAVQKQAS